MRKKIQYYSSAIFYTMEGKGEPVVLLHGFGEDSRIWDLQVDFLKLHCLLIVPDLPGSGESVLLDSNAINTSDPISITDYADCIRALLHHENISSCIMLGHSMGGYITLAFAEKYPSLFTAFGLINSTAYADSDDKKKTRERGIQMIEEYGSYPFLKNTIPNLFGAHFKEIYPEKMNLLIEAGAGFTKAALQQYYRAMMLRPDRTSVLLSNRLPVLFVSGTEDVAAPLADVLKQVSLPDMSYLYVLQSIGHMSMWEAPEKLNHHMLDFINR